MQMRQQLPPTPPLPMLTHFRCLRRHFDLYFQRDGVVDLSEVRDAMVKSTGSNEMGHPCIRSKII